MENNLVEIENVGSTISDGGLNEIILSYNIHFIYKKVHVDLKIIW